MKTISGSLGAGKISLLHGSSPMARTFWAPWMPRDCVVRRQKRETYPTHGSLKMHFSAFGAGRLQIFLLLFLIHSAFYISAFSQRKIKTIPLDDYYAVLENISDKTMTWEADWSPDSLIKFLANLPDTVKVSYVDASGKQGIKEISNQWIKRSFEPNGGWVNASYNDTLRIAENLALRIDEYNADLRESWGEETGDTSAASKVKNILSNKRFEKEKVATVNPDERDRDRRIGINSDKDRSGLWLLFALIVTGFVFFLLQMGSQVDFAVTPEDIEISSGAGLLKEGEPTRSLEMGTLGKQSAANGKLEAALRYYYLSFILLLHERKIIRYKSSYTVWEYYQLMTEKNFPDSAVYEVSESFDRSIYGKSSVNATELDQFEKNLSLGIAAINQSKP